MSTGMATDFSRQRFGEGRVPSGPPKIGSALAGSCRSESTTDSIILAARCEFRVPMFASEPIEQHRRGENQGSGIGFVLAGDIRRGAVLRLCHARAIRPR